MLRALRPYGISLFIVASASLLQWVFWSYLKPLIFFCFYPAVVLAVLYGEALTAIVLSIAGANLFAFYTEVVEFDWVRGLIRAVTFAAFGLVIRHLGLTRTRAIRELIEDRDKLRLLADSLQDAREDFSLAVSASEIGIWKWDVVLDRITWSDRLQQLYGLQPGEFAGSYEQYLSLAHPEDREHLVRTIRRAIDDKKPYTVEHRVLWQDGTLRWLSGRGQAFFDSQGRLARMTGTATDVTERKDAEDALKRALRSRDEFLSIASHELKTPLTSLKLQTQLRQRTAQGSGIDPRVSKVIFDFDADARQVDRLTRLVDDMLDVSRISSGRLSVDREPTDLAELVSEILARHSAQLQSAGCVVRYEVRAPVVGQWDRFRLDQVMTNLLTNATKYGAGKPIEISIERSSPGRVRLRVTDHGMGIGKEDQQRIFGRFERGSETGAISGLGLGLYICKEIVEMHRGRIWVESEPGRGSSFFVELPTESREKLLAASI